ncbi:hypothetical protein [Chitinophaga pinensis]|uniref:hypothetical protein n=1 Tax=Chitinophaga pinensis TaxID=79329 RepID=UPI00031CE1D4|nr:hypothetical protein [Chitinophaga pinensis]
MINNKQLKGYQEQAVLSLPFRPAGREPQQDTLTPEMRPGIKGNRIADSGK